MSWKPEVTADSSGKWYGNALRFATREEAEANVRDLMMRWLAVRDTRVTECDDPVNYAWVDGKLVSLEDSYQPKTGERCACKPGEQRDNCPDCEGTGWRIDFKAIRARRAAP